MKAKYFTEDEFRCQCGCDQVKVDENLLYKLDSLRAIVNFPLQVTSGYRCPDHPIEARKQTPGTHSTGKAVDIGVSREKAHKVLYVALEMGFTGIGVQQKGNNRFIHLDVCTDEDGFSRPTVWSY